MNVTSFALFYRSAVFTGLLLLKAQSRTQHVTLFAARYRIIQRQGSEFIVKIE
jgi:hypothetical protein